MNSLAELINVKPQVPVAPVEPERFEKIARFMAHKIPQKQIAEMLGISEGRLSQIIVQPDYLLVQNEVFAEYGARSIETDDAYDKLEHLALQNLEFTLQYSKDPDLNLKVATMANKAIRRTRPGNKPLEVENTGQRVVLNLTTRTIKNLGKTQVLNDRGYGEGLTETQEVETTVERTVQIEKTASADFSEGEITSLLGAVDAEGSNITFSDLVPVVG